MKEARFAAPTMAVMIKTKEHTAVNTVHGRSCDQRLYRARGPCRSFSGSEDASPAFPDEWGRIIAAPFACARRGEGGDSGDPASVLYRRMRGRRDAVGATRTATRAARCGVQHSSTALDDEKTSEKSRRAVAVGPTRARGRNHRRDQQTLDRRFRGGRTGASLCETAYERPVSEK